MIHSYSLIYGTVFAEDYLAPVLITQHVPHNKHVPHLRVLLVSDSSLQLGGEVANSMTRGALSWLNAP